MWTGLGGGLGPTGTLGQILLNPPGQLFVTTRIPFAPNEGANELGCLPPVAPPLLPRSLRLCLLLPREKEAECVNCLLCVYPGFLTSGWTSNPSFPGHYLTHLIRLRRSRMRRPGEPCVKLIGRLHLERSGSWDTARPRKKKSHPKFRSVDLVGLERCLQSTCNPRGGRQQLTRNNIDRA